MVSEAEETQASGGRARDKRSAKWRDFPQKTLLICIKFGL